MSKHFFIFLGTFVVGALLALTVRAARSTAPTTAESSPSAVQAPAAPSVDHSAHSRTATADQPTSPADSAKPVNTVCAICGMDVDPDLPTATYQGKTIGFGCKACPPKFKANPDKYGPAYLRNEVIEN